MSHTSHDEIYTLDIGTFNIYNINVNLVAILVFKGLNVTITLPLPINYPTTNIGNSSIVKKEGLFRALITIVSSDNNSWMELVNIAQYNLNINASFAMALNAYYVVPKQHKIEPIGDELFLLTGLGKKVLCLSMIYIMNRFKFQPHTTIMVLEASGGTISTDDDIKRVNNYLFMGRNKLLSIYCGRYPQLHNSYNVVTERDIAKLLVLLENNSKLVDYYKQYLGFIQLSSISLETPMGTTVDNILNYCNV